MKPLFILIGVFMTSNLIIFLVNGKTDYLLAGKIALSTMLLFTAIAHFVFTKGMVLMLPDFVPFKLQIIYLTGLIEIAAAIGIFVTDVSRIAGVLLILFFLLILPVNIYAAFKNLNYETGSFDGSGIKYLWFRVPFQIVLILWTYYFVVK